MPLDEEDRIVFERMRDAYNIQTSHHIARISVEHINVQVNIDRPNYQENLNKLIQ